MVSRPSAHVCVGAAVLACNVALVIATVVLDKVHHVKPPSAGTEDTSSIIGWLGTAGAIFIFGCYGILIKTPSVVAARVHAMVFQVYYSLGVAVISFVIWAFAGSSDGFTYSWLGIVFAAFWVGSQVFAFNAIQRVGYAVGPSIWAGLTIIISFLWGGIAFKNKVVSVPGSMLAILLLVFGVFMAAASGSDLPKKMADRLRRRGRPAAEVSVKPQNEPFVGVASENSPDMGSPADMPGAAAPDEQQHAAESSSSAIAVGFVCAMATGLLNGSLMMPMTTFQGGSSLLGISGYDGDTLAAIAFLPSLAIGILIVTPVFFLLYFARTLASGVLPEFHLSVAALPGFLTGCFWGMGNFSAMFASTYLGQTVGFPLTQTCIIINGLWGIFYYKEMKDPEAIILFALAAVVIIAGAYVLGKFG